MASVTVCWAPECGNVVPPPRRGRQGLYCSGRCRVKAVRRNGGTAPSEPYPPLEPQPAVPVLTAPPPPPPPARKPRKAARPAVRSKPPEGPAPGLPTPTQGDPVPASESEHRGGPVAVPRAETDPESAPASVTQLHVAVTGDSTVPVSPTVHPMVAAYKADLAKIGQDGTRQGLQVVEMAEKLVSSATSPAAAANLSKELQRLMGELEEQTTDAKVSRDPSLIIRERTLAKLRALSEPAEEATA